MSESIKEYAEALDGFSKLIKMETKIKVEIIKARSRVTKAREEMRAEEREILND